MRPAFAGRGAPLALLLRSCRGLPMYQYRSVGVVPLPVGAGEFIPLGGVEAGSRQVRHKSGKRYGFFSIMEWIKTFRGAFLGS